MSLLYVWRKFNDGAENKPINVTMGLKSGTGGQYGPKLLRK